jgi:hypothetical protein
VDEQRELALVVRLQTLESASTETHTRARVNRGDDDRSSSNPLLTPSQLELELVPGGDAEIGLEARATDAEVQNSCADDVTVTVPQMELDGRERDAWPASSFVQAGIGHRPDQCRIRPELAGGFGVHDKRSIVGLKDKTQHLPWGGQRRSLSAHDDETIVDDVLQRRFGVKLATARRVEPTDPHGRAARWCRVGHDSRKALLSHHQPSPCHALYRQKRLPSEALCRWDLTGGQ